MDGPSTKLAPTPPYLALLRAGFCLPPTLPPARCALTAPFHPYPSTFLPRASRETGSLGAVCFLCHCPSGCPARALPGALPFGVRTFLSLQHFTVARGFRKQRSSSRLRRVNCTVWATRRASLMSLVLRSWSLVHPRSLAAAGDLGLWTRDGQRTMDGPRTKAQGPRTI